MRHPLRISAACLAAAGLLFIVGCGDVVTYAKYSRRQGIDQMTAGNDDAAAGSFRDALRQNPGDYESSYYLGTLYAKGGRYVEAAGQFKSAMAVQKATWDGRNDKALHIKILKAYAAAVAKVDDHDTTVNELEADSKSSTTGDEAYELALIFTARGDADSAIGAYAHAAEQAPQSFDIAKDQGLFLTQISQKAPAEEALRRAYRLNQSDNQVNDALRSLGIIPGPSLMTQDQMAKPLIPVGPIPNYIDKWTGKDKPADGTAQPAAPAAPAD